MHDIWHHSHAHDGIFVAPVDKDILTADRGIWALKWSFVGMMATALLQVVLFFYTHSVALLADTIHNFGDAFTAYPFGWPFSSPQKNPHSVSLTVTAGLKT